MTGTTIASLLGEAGPFYRSVSIERDRLDPGAGRSYVLTPWLERSAAEFLNGLKVGSTRRAWRIVGDFGVGKSALALALIQALDPRSADPETAIGRLSASLGGVPKLYPVVLSGSRAGFRAGLAHAIARGLKEDNGLIPPARRKVVAAIDDPFEALIALRDAVVATTDFDGLLLVVDEMGKFLETASSEDEDNDVFRLQALAEQAVRSGAKPLSIILVLHQGFQSYAEGGTAARRTEWAKIAERFDELVFDHPLSHTAALLSAALNVAALPGDVAAAYDSAAVSVREFGWLGPREGDSQPSCYPLHPATVPVLARFFAEFGQNERSLFGFVASGEPNSLRAFAATNDTGAGLYRLDHFFDYITSCFGHRLMSRSGGGDWGRIRAVLEGAAEADACETAILKAVGLLNLLDAPDLLATDSSVLASLTPGFDKTVVAEALVRLRKQGLLFERSGRSGLRLWTSRRVDLSALWEDANREVPARSVSSQLAHHLAALPVRDHVLARRHTIERGTSRRFVIGVVPAKALAMVEPQGGADGSVICILTTDQDELHHAKAWAAEVTDRDPTVIVLVAPPMPDTAPLMIDLLRYRWMMVNAIALQEDSFASAEIERGAADLEARLVGRLEMTFGLGGSTPDGSVRLYYGGARRNTPPPVHIIISEVCDELFKSAPLIANELVNRHTLTSAGAGARQRLIEAMFAHGHQFGMKFDGTRNPPERALYLSVLQRGKVHRAEADGWTIAIPSRNEDPLKLHPALTMVSDLLSGTADRVVVSDIYRKLARRPFGVRQGLAPLLLAIVLVANRHRVALFERDTYCPKLDGPAFMRILKSPDLFALQWVSLEGVRADVFRRLATIVEGADVDAGLLTVVTPLVRFAAELPFHVQRATTLGNVAMAVRDALGRARSPVDLIFYELPKACGVESFDPNHGDGDTARVSDFIDRLETAIAELRGCFPALLVEMRAELAGLMGGAADVRADLQRRAAPLLFRIHEQNLKTFALRLADANLADDPWIEALGGAVVGKPPSRWLTSDVGIWRSRLDELASAFLRVEAAAFATGPQTREALRLSLTHVDGREHSVVVDFDDPDENEDIFAHALVRMIDDSIFSYDRMLALLSLQALRRRTEVPSDDARDDNVEVNR